MTLISSNLAAWGYGLAALAYLALTVMILTSWRQRSQAYLLVTATLLTAIWAGVEAASSFHDALASLGLALEICRNGSWLALLLYILRLRIAPIPVHVRMLQGLSGLVVVGLLLMLVLPWGFPNLVLGELLLPTGFVALTVIGLVAVEQVYRSTRAEDRWAIKFLCLGLGGLFIFDFYLFANAALFRSLNPEIWSARGFVITLIAPLIAVSAARNPQWSVPVGLSRNMAFHTASLLGAGIYLLLMAGAGYYLRIFGGDWGTIVQAVFVFAAALLLGVAATSGTFRARLRVFLSKHFFSYRYDYREEWLKFTRTLSSGAPGERLGEHAIESLAQLVESPGGALWLKEEDSGYQRVAHWNWSTIQGQEPDDSAFIKWASHKQWVIDIQEALRQPERYPALTLPGWLADITDAWLFIPLMQHDEMLGFILLKPSLGKISFNWEVSDLLKVAARQAATHLAQMRASNALIVARQFESFNRTTTFVIHDLKNLVAQLSLLLANAEKHKHNPDFQSDMLETIENAVTRMNKVLTQLRRGEANDAIRSVSLTDVLTEAAASKRAFKLQPDLQLPDPDLQVRADKERLTRAVGHILQNALEATPQTGKVSLSTQQTDDMAVIEIRDNGIGMEETFIRNHLFQPFDSTKGAGMGIGAYESRETLRAMGGNIEVKSTPGQGTVFRLSLPLDRSSNNVGARVRA